MSGAPTRPGVLFFLVAVGLAWAGVATTLVLAGEALVAVGAAASAFAFLAAAKVRAARSPRLLLAGAAAERAAEAMILGGIAWVALPERPGVVAAAMTALGASYTATYLHIRAAGLGFRVGEPIWLRTAIWVAVAAGVVMGWVLWIAVALSTVDLAWGTAGVVREGERG
jgi:hypothetical protein